MSERRHSAFLSGLVTGIAGLTAFAAPASPIRYPYATDADALRSDWQVVGDDMRAAMRRTDEEVEKAPAK
jgi:hypothetical protein